MRTAIFIPTRGRPDRQRTLEALVAAGMAKEVHLVVSYDDPDRERYKSRWGSIVVRARDIAEKRQCIVDFARAKKLGKIIMMDDDLTFFARAKAGFLKAEPKRVRAMVSLLDDVLDDYAHAGITDKFMCNSRPSGYALFGRYNQVLGYNVSMWPKDVRFRVPINEEHDVNLQLCVSGLPPYISRDYSKDAKYYSDGGCSEWRTKTVETRAMKEFAKLWPDYVKLVPTKHSISGLAARVRWRAAVKVGQEAPPW